MTGRIILAVLAALSLYSCIPQSGEGNQPASTGGGFPGLEPILPVEVTVLNPYTDPDSASLRQARIRLPDPEQTFFWLPCRNPTRGRSFRNITDIIDNTGYRRQLRSCVPLCDSLQQMELIVLRMQVGSDGRPFTVRVAATTLNNIDLISCLISKATTWQFSPGDEEMFDIPFALVPVR